MRPVYVKKRNARERTTWIDHFVASEPKGGFRSVVELARGRRI